MSGNPKHRVHRQHKGLWVYGVRRATGWTPARVGSGIQPGIKVNTITLKDIAAVVSEVDLHQFGERQLKEKLAKDLGWTKRSVQRHHDVIVKAGAGGTIAPMQFGTIFATRKNLEVMLTKYYRKFKSLLSQLKDREEWVVKVYLDRDQFIERLKKKDQVIQRFENRKAKTPEGMKWYLERKIDGVIQQKFEGAMVKHLAKIVRTLEQGAERVVLNDLYPQQLTGKELVLNTACLIKKEARGPFKENMRKLFKGFEESGFTGAITGPWPPYNFVGIKK